MHLIVNELTLKFNTTMKKAILSLFILGCFYLPGYAQNADSAKPVTDTAQHKNKIHVALLGTAGVNMLFLDNNLLVDTIIGKHNKLNPTVYRLNQKNMGPCFAIGIDLRGSKRKFIDNIFSFGFTRFTGTYAYAYGSYAAGSGIYEETDSVKGSYVTNVFKFQYAIQLTDKYVFGSFGIGCFFSSVSYVENGTKVINWSPPESFQWYTYSTPINNSGSFTNINVPITFTLGGIIRVKKMEFRLAGYIDITPTQSYNAFGFTLTVLHIPKGFN